MRLRKKPDLRLNIPSYPHDYVEMPPAVRRQISELSQNSPSIQFIDEDTPEREGARTPVIRIIGPEDSTDLHKSENENFEVIATTVKVEEEITTERPKEVRISETPKEVRISETLKEDIQTSTVKSDVTEDNKLENSEGESNKKNNGAMNEEKANTTEAESPVVYRDKLRKTSSVSVPHGMQYEGTDKVKQLNVSD